MSECILSPYVPAPNGYSGISVNNKRVQHHRLAYCLAHGLQLEDIKGKVVMHTCDVRRCINPEHLVLGTHAENSADMVRKSRQAKGAKVGTATLSDAQAEEILHIIKTQRHSIKELASRYNVTVHVIYTLTSGPNWKHLKQKAKDESI